MTSKQIVEAQAEIRALEDEEIESVTGGVNVTPIDMSGMPDWTVCCGTLWLLLHPGKMFPGTQH
jgi:hypothetical protein